MNYARICLMIFFSFVSLAEGAFNRCFVCRSRGDLGSCKDPFEFTNVTSIPDDHGVQTVPCTSGWCGKTLDRGTDNFQDAEYGAATERLCLPRGPSDNEERCAQTKLGNKKVVYMCFCQGDLCNSSLILRPSILLYVLISIKSVLYFTL